jgi:hypothetical protein
MYSPSFNLDAIAVKHAALIFLLAPPARRVLARQNFVDHSLTDKSSIIHFVEDKWLGGQRIVQGSFDAIASSISQMFDFTKKRDDGTLFLSPSTGEAVK